jgi:DNA-binding Lrp family transcriptional regulator
VIGLIACFISSFSFGQVALAMPEYNVVYRGYDNKFEIGAGADTRFIVLESTQAEVFRGDFCFYVRLNGPEKTITVTMKNLKENKVLKTYEFRVLNMPVPSVYVGSALEGTTVVTLDNAVVRVGYEETAVLQSAGFDVISYEVTSVSIANPLPSITGSKITPEVIEALRKAKEASKGKPITFNLVVQAKGKDGLIRKRTAAFIY